MKCQAKQGFKQQRQNSSKDAIRLQDRMDGPFADSLTPLLAFDRDLNPPQCAAPGFPFDSKNRTLVDYDDLPTPAHNGLSNYPSKKLFFRARLTPRLCGNTLPHGNVLPL